MAIEKGTFSTNTFYTILRLVLATVLTLITMVIISRFYGPEGQGTYTLIVLIPTVIYTFINFGIPVSTIFFVGKRKYFSEDIVRTNILLSLLLSAGGMLIGVIVILIFKDTMFESMSTDKLYLILTVLPFLFISNILQCLFQGLENFKYYCFANLSHFFFLTLCVVILTLFQIENLTYLIYGFIASHIFALIISFIFLKRSKLRYWLGQYQHDIMNDIMSFGIRNHLSTVLTFLNYRLDIFFVSYFTTVDQVGLYTNAVNVVERLWLFSYAVSAVLFARISGMTSESQKNILTTKMSRNVFWVSVLGGIFFYFIGEWLILFLFGEPFRESCQPLLYLIPGVVMTSHSRVLSNDLAARGRPEINSWFAFGVVIVNVILNYLLIPDYGINGAAIATSSTYLMEAWGKIIVFKKLTRVSFKDLFVLNRDDWLTMVDVIKSFKSKIVKS